ncbi:glycosyltransferase family 4 protein [Natrononativus amylolyticus]|uniref:glycosyltransferase family 4 protein n=1 Tax=Natrononativus amylolyticus TaxID=2963434 RepID=UPI0020CE99B8|nr:glycosyltransferase family 4 protein [Natrononativus amylolyticus]
MSRGRVLLRDNITTYDPEKRGGSGTYVHNLSKGLARKNWEVDVLTPYAKDNSPPDYDNIEYITFKYPNPNSPFIRLIQAFKGGRMVKNIIESNDYDLVIDNISHLPHIPLHFFARNTKTAVIIHNFRLSSSKDIDGRIKGTVVEWVDRTIPYLGKPHIICAGPSTEMRIRDYHNYSRTSILRPCVNTTHLQYNFSPESKTLLFLGRLVNVKNIPVLLKAWEIINKRHPDYQLVIAGKGRERKKLESIVQSENINNVVFPGFVKGNEKKSLLENSLAMIIPSYFEGYVTTGIEALAAGTIVIGSDTRGINDYIDDGVNGLLFPINDVNSLVEQLNKVINNPEEFRNVSERGYETAKNHTFEEFSKNADELVEEIIKCD